MQTIEFFRRNENEPDEFTTSDWRPYDPVHAQSAEQTSAIVNEFLEHFKQDRDTLRIFDAHITDGSLVVASHEYYIVIKADYFQLSHVRRMLFY